jgi:hypothetical protein
VPHWHLRFPAVPKFGQFFRCLTCNRSRQFICLVYGRGAWHIYRLIGRELPMVFFNLLRLRQWRVIPKPSLSSPVLQRLDHLDRSSPDFHDQLCNVLYGEEYVQCVSNLQGNDLVWLVDYLDRVRRRVALSHSLLKLRRLSVISILPVPPPGNACANSGAFVAPRGYSQHRTRFRLAISRFFPSR